MSFQEGGDPAPTETLHLDGGTGGYTISIAKTLATTSFSKATLKYIIKLKLLLQEKISQTLLS